MSDIIFSCIEVKQPIGSFYIGMMDAVQVLSVSYADVRRLGEREVETYLGIQRPLDPKRVKEIAAYVRTIDACFPTSILLHVNSADVTFDPETNKMTLRNDDKVAKILDGQHRIAGLEGFGDTFQLNVVLFVDMDTEDQATIFSTINLAQTKVNKSLVYDLFEYSKLRSPQKSCHQICRVLDSQPSSPFYHSIRILGVADKSKTERVTQATFVERLIKYVSTNADEDRDLIKRKKPLRPNPNLIFRQMFIEGQDARLGQVVWNYFEAVKRRWPTEWSATEKGNLLARSTGFIAFIRFLDIAYRSFGEPNYLPTVDEFKAIFDRMTLTAADFTVDELQYGSGGQKSLFDKLNEQYKAAMGSQSLFEDEHSE